MVSAKQSDTLVLDTVTHTPYDTLPVSHDVDIRWKFKMGVDK